jgi:solute carrier family 35 protein E1
LTGSLVGSPAAVGAAWMISSALLTTYSTTRFLKYNGNDDNGRSESVRFTNPSAPVGYKQKQRRINKWPNSKLLQHLNRPSLLTLYRFGGSFLLGLLLHPNLYIRSRLLQTINAAPVFLWPAIFLFVANLSNSVALNRIGIPLTYTSKCGIPVATVALTVLLDGGAALPPTLALLALLPIAAGIAMASWSSPHYEPVGFVAAILSTASQSALNVSSKRAMTKTGVTGSAAQRVMVWIGLLLTVCVTAMQQYITNNNSNAANSSSNGGTRQGFLGAETTALHALPPPVWLSAMAVFAYHLEYVLSFMFVKLVQPVTYGTCDAVRRLAIILSGRAMFGGARLTAVNKVGIALSLAGALGYSMATAATASV